MKQSKIVDISKYETWSHFNFGPMFMLVPIQSKLAELFITKIKRDEENNCYI